MFYLLDQRKYTFDNFCFIHCRGYFFYWDYRTVSTRFAFLLWLVFVVRNLQYDWLNHGAANLDCFYYFDFLYKDVFSYPTLGKY